VAADSRTVPREKVYTSRLTLHPRMVGYSPTGIHHTIAGCFSRAIET
jgi:hypothetical protein